MPKKSSPQKEFPLSVPKAGFTRCTFTFPADLSMGIKRLSQKMGVSQSALVVSLLNQTIPDLEQLISAVEDNSDDTRMRLRGQSIDLIMTRVGEALKEL